MPLHGTQALAPWFWLFKYFVILSNLYTLSALSKAFTKLSKVVYIALHLKQRLNLMLLVYNLVFKTLDF
jgi:hypothetical protein